MDRPSVKRGEIWWGNLGEPRGSAPAFERPFLVLQADSFNRSGLNTIIGVTLTTNPRHANFPGNVYVTPLETGLPEDSVVIVSQLVTLDRMFLIERVGQISKDALAQVEFGLKLVLSLEDE